MGRKNYTGGGTLLNSEATFRSFDSAEPQKRDHIRDENLHGPVKPSFEYSIQVQFQLTILLKKIAKGRKRPFVPSVFRAEIEAFDSLYDWAETKPEFRELIFKKGRKLNTKRNRVKCKKSPPSKRRENTQKLIRDYEIKK